MTAYVVRCSRTAKYWSVESKWTADPYKAVLFATKENARLLAKFSTWYGIVEPAP